MNTPTIGGPAATQTPLLSQEASPPGPASLISLNMNLEGLDTNSYPGSVHYFRTWRPWKCSLFSDLETMEVFTIFGSENRGSVHYFRPWKCLLLSDLKTLEVFTIFESENRGCVYYFRNWKPWKCRLFPGLETLEMYTIFGTENSRPANALELYTILGTATRLRVVWLVCVR